MMCTYYSTFTFADLSCFQQWDGLCTELAHCGDFKLLCAKLVASVRLHTVQEGCKKAITDTIVEFIFHISIHQYQRRNTITQ